MRARLAQVKMWARHFKHSSAISLLCWDKGSCTTGLHFLDWLNTFRDAACSREPVWRGEEVNTGMLDPSILLLSSLSLLTEGEGGGVLDWESLSRTSSSKLVRDNEMWDTWAVINFLNSVALLVEMSSLGVASSSLQVRIMVRPRVVVEGVAGVKRDKICVKNSG